MTKSGLSYAILRPAIFFGREDILINNIAWMLRRFPFMGVFGDGEYRLQPIYVDDLADLLIDLPEAVTQEVLQSLDKQDHERVQQVLAYDEESAGGLMNVDIVTVRPDVTLEVVARYLRVVGEITDGTDGTDAEEGFAQPHIHRQRTCISPSNEVAV